MSSWCSILLILKNKSMETFGYMMIVSTITSMMVSKIDLILSILGILLFKLMRYESCEIIIMYEDKISRYNILDWISKNTLISTKKTLGERQVPYGYILLKGFKGFITLNFEESGYENGIYKIQGWCLKNTNQELRNLWINKEDTEDEEETKKSLFEEVKEEVKEEPKKFRQTTLAIYNLTVSRSGKYNDIIRQNIKYVSYYNQPSKQDQPIPECLRDQYDCIQKILTNMKRRKDLGFPESYRILLTGKPGTGKTHVGYELANHLKNSKLIPSFSPIEPGENSWEVLESLKRKDTYSDISSASAQVSVERPYVIFMINEFDVMYDRVERNEIQHHKQLKTQITDMRKLLDWLEMMGKVDGVLLILTTNREKEYFPERVTRKGRIDMIYEFHQTIAHDIENEL